MLYGNRERCCVETESDAVLKQSDAVLLNVHHEYYQFFCFCVKCVKCESCVHAFLKH